MYIKYTRNIDYLTSNMTISQPIELKKLEECSWVNYMCKFDIHESFKTFKLKVLKLMVN